MFDSLDSSCEEFLLHAIRHEVYKLKETYKDERSS